MFLMVGLTSRDNPLDFVAQAGLPEDGSPQRTVPLKKCDFFGGGIALFFFGRLLE